jgi:cytochrome P450
VLDTCALTNTAPFTLLNRLQAPPNPNHNHLDALDIAAECLDHMAAGIDTTGDALCFLMWELSLPRSLPYQRKLQHELLTNPNARTNANFDKLPYLDAVVLEGLRCFPPIPMSLPRYVPAGGRSIDGVFLPQGTAVSCQAYSVQRMDGGGGVFPEPDAFRPERWLAPEGDAERKRRFFAFASGGRGCVGKQYVFLFSFFGLQFCALLTQYTHALTPSVIMCDGVR